MVVKDGVDFDALDGEPVTLIFLIAAPNTEDNVHLDVLSKDVYKRQALRLHSNKSMHTDCKKRSLTRDCLGIALQMQGNTSRDSGRLNCYKNTEGI